MAYTLTLEDLQPNQQPYVLNLEDIQSAQQPQEGLLQRAAAYPGRLAEEVGGAPLSQSIPTAAGGVQRGLQYMVSGLAPFQLGQLESPISGAQSPFQQPELAQIPGEAPEQMPFLAHASEWAPEVAATAYSLPGLARAGKAGLQAGKSAFENIAAGKASKTAKNFINELLGGVKPGKAHIEIADDLRSIGAKNTAASTENYTNFLNEGRAQGYADDVAKGFPGISIGGQKTKSIDNALSRSYLEDIKPTSNELKTAMDAFNKNPSLNSAHRLQSELGSEAANLSASSVGSERTAGKTLGSARTALRSDIENSLVKNGDANIADLYQDATDFHRQYVAPFRENAQIRKVTFGKGLREKNPENIHNLLKKDDADLVEIKNQLSQQSKNLIAAKAMKPSFYKSKGKVNLRGDIPKFVERGRMLDDKGFGEFVSGDFLNALDLIEKQYKRRKLGLYGAGIGIVAAGGPSLAKKAVSLIGG